MGLTPADFIIVIEFGDDSGKVTLGSGHELYVEPADGNKSVGLDDSKLDLIRRIQAVEDEVTGTD